MKYFLLQVRQYGYRTISAESQEEAEEQCKDMRACEFDMTKECDIEIVNETDINGCAIEEEE